jgi:hypothetical protein
VTKLSQNFSSTPPTKVKKFPHHLQVGARRASMQLIQPNPHTMKKTLLAILGLAAVSLAGVNGQTVLLSFDFAGALSSNASNTQNSTFNATDVLSSQMTRGSAIGNNNAANGFRGLNFSNTGIALEGNNRFFQFTLEAAPQNTLTVNSIYGNFVGTGSFFTTTGVTVAYGYSLNGGTSFTQMSSFNLGAAGNSTYTITGTEATNLTDVSSVIFRMYASGNTTSGGFGLGSAATPGTIGLSVSGSVVPEPSTWALIGLGGAFILWRIRRRRVVG